MYRVTLLACCLALTAIETCAGEIDFTRYLSRHIAGTEVSRAHQATFFGVVGDARLIVTSANRDIGARVKLNGVEVFAPTGSSTKSRVDVPVTLVENNTIAVVVEGQPGSSVSIRVKQIADVELQVQSRVHFNTNVSNFEAARDFYGKLGFKTLSGFPDTNTQGMARAIGIETPTSYDGAQGESAGGYLLHGELVGVGGFEGGLIDLIAFTIPKNEAPPYARLNHLGMARAAMHTTNLDADYRKMKEAGIEFLSPPVTRSNRMRFAIFKDLDGTHYELIEVDGEDETSDTTHIVGLAQVNVNVSDFERSRAWYQMLGHGDAIKLPATDSVEVANAMGFDEPFEINGAIVTLPGDGSTLELAQWITPYDPERAYDIPVNHLGIHRMAFATTDIAADVAALKAQGVEFVSEVTPCCSGEDSSGSIVAFYDPDGTVVELVEQPYMSEMFSVLKWFRKMFF